MRVAALPAIVRNKCACFLHRVLGEEKSVRTARSMAFRSASILGCRALKQRMGLSEKLTGIRFE